MMRKSTEEQVTLNVTAMLDMAFQLLAFFVLTFKPPPIEAQIFLKLPPAQQVLGQGKESAGQTPDKNPADIKPVKSLIVNLDDGGSGTLSKVGVGISTEPLKDVPYNELETELRDRIQQQGYEQLVLQFSATLHWEEVMKVVDMCAKIPTKDGELPKLSFACVGERQED
jgi:biopolymer transport protein ExbD